MNSLFAPIFSDGTVVVESEVLLVDDQLMPEELACVRNAAGRRRAQFGTGRLCARRAIATLGLPSGPLTVRADGAPAWPSGAVGSITHTSTYCAAVVKPSPPWRSVGLDAEDLRPLDAGIVESITTEAERRWLQSSPQQTRDAHALLLFSAKEAYYKLQHPLTNRFLDFPEVEIETDLQGGIFRASARVEMPAELAVVSGRFVFASGKVLSGVELL
jgi:4'-phosphopantetheinyl transferase EntD